MNPSLSHSPHRKITPEMITSLAENEVFVFGSNLQGMHGGGAARQALKWGAIMGQGEGIQGNTYALPTMFRQAGEIQPYVDRFIAYATQHPEKQFLVTAIGCGVAGFSVEEIAPLFKELLRKDLKNISLPAAFWHCLATF